MRTHNPGHMVQVDRSQLAVARAPLQKINTKLTYCYTVVAPRDGGSCSAHTTTSSRTGDGPQAANSCEQQPVWGRLEASRSCRRRVPAPLPLQVAVVAKTVQYIPLLLQVTVLLHWAPPAAAERIPVAN